MGLNTRNFEKRTYVGIIQGKFATKADSTTQGAVKRYSEKKAMDVWETLYDDITGRITDIRIEESQFGKQLVVTINDIVDMIHVQIPVESKYFWHFAMKVPNVNLNQDVMIVPYSFEDKVKKDLKGNPQRITGLNFYQPATKTPNNKIDYYYKDGDSHGKPVAEKDMDDDDYKIFKIREQKFLVEQVSKIMVVTEKEVHEEMGVSHETTYPTKENEEQDFDVIDDDDLPF